MKKLGIVVVVVVLLLAGVANAYPMPQGIYSDPLQFSVMHFKGEYLTIYQATMPIGKWKMIDCGDHIFLEPITESSKRTRMLVKDNGYELEIHLLDLNQKPFTIDRQEPGTIKTMLGVLY